MGGQCTAEAASPQERSNEQQKDRSPSSPKHPRASRYEAGGDESTERNGRNQNSSPSRRKSVPAAASNEQLTNDDVTSVGGAAASSQGDFANLKFVREEEETLAQTAVLGRLAARQVEASSPHLNTSGNSSKAASPFASPVRTRRHKEPKPVGIMAPVVTDPDATDATPATPPVFEAKTNQRRASAVRTPPANVHNQEITNTSSLAAFTTEEVTELTQSRPGTRANSTVGWRTKGYATNATFGETDFSAILSTAGEVRSAVQTPVQAQLHGDFPIAPPTGIMLRPGISGSSASPRAIALQQQGKPGGPLDAHRKSELGGRMIVVEEDEEDLHEEEEAAEIVFGEASTMGEKTTATYTYDDPTTNRGDSDDEGEEIQVLAPTAENLEIWDDWNTKDAKLAHAERTGKIDRFFRLHSGMDAKEEATWIGSHAWLRSWLDEQLAVRVRRTPRPKNSGPGGSMSSTNTIGGFSVSSCKPQGTGVGGARPLPQKSSNLNNLNNSQSSPNARMGLTPNSSATRVLRNPNQNSSGDSTSGHQQPNTPGGGGVASKAAFEAAAQLATADLDDEEPTMLVPASSRTTGTVPRTGSSGEMHDVTHILRKRVDAQLHSSTN